MYPVSEGRVTFSSGTTNTPKKIWHSKEKLNLTSEVYKRTHNLDASCRILNFMPRYHIGGLALELAGEYVGALITNVEFNPYGFLEQLKEYSHTMLPDSSITALRKTKKFDDYNFSNKFLFSGWSLTTIGLSVFFIKCLNVFSIHHSKFKPNSEASCKF